MNEYIMALIVVILVVVVYNIRYKNEPFGIPFTESTPWGWNVATDYHAPNTGYGLYGNWPKLLLHEPWKWWMWGRRPDHFITPFSPVPQIDYNAGGTVSVPSFNIVFSEVNGMMSANGRPHSVLQLDRNKVYYISVITPTKQFMLTADKQTPLYFNPTTMTRRSLVFGDDLPDTLFYCDAHDPTDCGIIYLNSIRADMNL